MLGEVATMSHRDVRRSDTVQDQCWSLDVSQDISYVGLGYDL
ncbi:Uncharacterised protein [Mycobacterium tuberculosis]|uniref:Uncharacterized protein n=1 Tax=Mycobacterium tuberculosis TaxID=1773 RepID=A0A654TYH0_MYCTX|nr:Uncharacterised protein [Mycobacterium tuberculosis]CFS44822.1 Uncharacterised protein [Mycobacterium tuberculosis]COZ45543.1 Uncharacterised protein [Mycobacterium tuberculosis]CPA86110.1 Uncharacterised protein [Mycobacterium tuberculosis]